MPMDGRWKQDYCRIIKELELRSTVMLECGMTVFSPVIYANQLSDQPQQNGIVVWEANQPGA